MVLSLDWVDRKEVAAVDDPSCAKPGTTIEPGKAQVEPLPGGHLPDAPSGRLLGSLSARWVAFLRPAFLLPTEAAEAKQLKRWLAGTERPSEAAIAALVRKAVADVATSRVIGWECPEPERELLAGRLMQNMAVVDMFGSAPAVWEHEQVTLAARWAAFALLTHAAVPQNLPRWMEGERDRFVEALAQERGTSAKEIRRQLVGTDNALSERTFAGIVAGERPGTEAVLMALSRILGVPSQRLRVHYACRALVKELNASWGPGEVNRWAEDLRGLATNLHRVFLECALTHQALARIVANGGSDVWGDLKMRVALSRVPSGAVRERLREHADRYVFPASPRLLLDEWWPVIRRLEASPGLASLVLMGLLARAARPLESTCVDPVRDRLRQVSALLEADEPAGASDLLEAVRGDHPTDPRVIMMSAVLAGQFGRRARAKTLAKQAAHAGYPGLRAVLEGLPEALGLPARNKR